MPAYDYRCKHCGHTFEASHSMKADSLVMCPVCKTPNLVRIIGRGGGMIFKGSGFYQTDYKNSKKDTGESKPKTSTPGEKKPAPDKKPTPPVTPSKGKE